jgi:4-aminobutyrate aminotransferase-like enzyme
MNTIHRTRLAELLAAEQRRFEATHPRSRALFERARGSLLQGVPMHWMAKWAGGFPLFVAEGQGAHFTDVDGHRYLDLCLGDTGAMTGHAPAATVAVVKRQAERGFPFMLPDESHLWVMEELTRRFGLAAWQFAMTATDVNRFAIRLARMLTGRPKILVHNWCYHGSVDETFATLTNGTVVPRPGNVPPRRSGAHHPGGGIQRPFRTRSRARAGRPTPPQQRTLAEQRPIHRQAVGRVRPQERVVMAFRLTRVALPPSGPTGSNRSARPENAGSSRLSVFRL